MVLTLLRRALDRPEKKQAQMAYLAIVAQARRPEFYERMGVPDTAEGRFELIILHLFLVTRRFGAQHPFSRLLIEAMISDLDRSLREMGVGDTGIGRRVKKLARALYGRLRNYEEAAAKGAFSQEASLRFRGTSEISWEAYLQDTQKMLNTQEEASLLRGAIRFPPPCWEQPQPPLPAVSAELSAG